MKGGKGGKRGQRGTGDIRKAKGGGIKGRWIGGELKRERERVRAI